MNNKFLTNFFCIALALLCCAGSSAPTVLCLGSDGHVEVEMVAHAVANPLGLSFTDSPGSFCGTFNPSHHQNHMDSPNTPCTDNEKDCEDCTDLLSSALDARTVSNPVVSVPVLHFTAPVSNYFPTLLPTEKVNHFLFQFPAVKIPQSVVLLI